MTWAPPDDLSRREIPWPPSDDPVGDLRCAKCGSRNKLMHLGEGSLSLVLYCERCGWKWSVPTLDLWKGSEQEKT